MAINSNSNPNRRIYVHFRVNGPVRDLGFVCCPIRSNMPVGILRKLFSRYTNRLYKIDEHGNETLLTLSDLEDSEVPEEVPPEEEGGGSEHEEGGGEEPEEVTPTTVLASKYFIKKITEAVVGTNITTIEGTDITDIADYELNDNSLSGRIDTLPLRRLYDSERPGEEAGYVIMFKLKGNMVQYLNKVEFKMEIDRDGGNVFTEDDFGEPLYVTIGAYYYNSYREDDTIEVIFSLKNGNTEKALISTRNLILNPPPM